MLSLLQMSGKTLIRKFDVLLWTNNNTDAQDCDDVCHCCRPAPRLLHYTIIILEGNKWQDISEIYNN